MFRIRLYKSRGVAFKFVINVLSQLELLWSTSPIRFYFPGSAQHSSSMQGFIPSSSLHFATSFLSRRSSEPTRACGFDSRRIGTRNTPQARVRVLQTPQVLAPPTVPSPTRFSSSSIPLEIDSSLYSQSLVILTGATGFTGSVILYKLLRDCPGSHIVVLARPQNVLSSRLSDRETSPPLLMHLVTTRLWRMISTSEVFSKLREGLSESKLLEMFQERISVMQVDFSDPNLGVPKGVLQSIVDVQSTASQNDKSFRDIRVLHCGSNVKFHDRLQNLMHDNVRSTINIIEMLSSLSTPVSHFVYVSSGKLNLSHFSLEEMNGGGLVNSNAVFLYVGFWTSKFYDSQKRTQAPTSRGQMCQ